MEAFSRLAIKLPQTNGRLQLFSDVLTRACPWS